MTEMTESPAAPEANFNFLGILNPRNYDFTWRVAQMLAQSDIVPDDYRGKPCNCMIALNMAQRQNTDVMMVMQNLHVIYGRTSWSALYVAAMIHGSRRFSPLRYEIIEDPEETDVAYEIFESKWVSEGGRNIKKNVNKTGIVRIRNIKCRAYATDLATNEIQYGPWVSLAMAIQEGWWFRNGSKWRTLKEIMLTNRATSFFGKRYIPDLMAGFMTSDEVRDAFDAEPQPDGSFAIVNGEIPESISQSVGDDALSGPERPTSSTAKRIDAEPQPDGSFAIVNGEIPESTRSQSVGDDALSGPERPTSSAAKRIDAVPPSQSASSAMPVNRGDANAAPVNQPAAYSYDQLAENIRQAATYIQLADYYVAINKGDFRAGEKQALAKLYNARKRSLKVGGGENEAPPPAPSLSLNTLFAKIAAATAIETLNDIEDLGRELPMDERELLNKELSKRSGQLLPNEN